jgi:hypothetical protein
MGLYRCDRLETSTAVPPVGVEPTGASPRRPAGGRGSTARRARRRSTRPSGPIDRTGARRLLIPLNRRRARRVDHPGPSRRVSLPSIAPVAISKATFHMKTLGGSVADLLSRTSRSRIRRDPPIRPTRDGCCRALQSASNSAGASPALRVGMSFPTAALQSNPQGDVSRETSGCSVADLVSRTSRSRAHRASPIRPTRDGCCRALSSASSSTGASPHPRGRASFRSIVLPKRRPLSMFAGNSGREGYFDAENRRTNVARGSGRANAEAVSTTARLHHARTGGGGPGRSTDDTSPLQRSFATATRPGSRPKYLSATERPDTVAFPTSVAYSRPDSRWLRSLPDPRERRRATESQRCRVVRARAAAADIDGDPLRAADVSRETLVQPVARDARTQDRQDRRPR